MHNSNVYLYNIQYAYNIQSLVSTFIIILHSTVDQYLCFVPVFCVAGRRNYLNVWSKNT